MLHCCDLCNNVYVPSKDICTYVQIYQYIFHVSYSGYESLEYKIFMDYYSTLVGTLPASDLAHYFVSERIISLDDYDKIIRVTLPQQASKLLLDRVSQQIQNGNSAVFTKMLMIMNHHDTITKELSQEIRSKVSALSHVNDLASDDGQSTYVISYK